MKRRASRPGFPLESFTCAEGFRSAHAIAQFGAAQEKFPLGAKPIDLDWPDRPLSHRRLTMSGAHNKTGARAAFWCVVRFALLPALAALTTGHAGSNSTGELSASPLASHSPSRGKTMFVELSPDLTGLKLSNPYNDPKMRGDLYLEFEGGSIGTGVAIGDYDGDGRPDIFVVSKTEGCRLFRNLGGYKFEDVTAKAGVGATPGIWNEGATFVDINNSGRLDIYVCRFNAPNLLYINQGDGTFKEMAHAYGLDVIDSSVMAAFCDYDRDGWLDLYITTNILNCQASRGAREAIYSITTEMGPSPTLRIKAGISGRGTESFGDLVGLRQRQLARPLCGKRLRRSRTSSITTIRMAPLPTRLDLVGASHLVLLDGRGSRRRK